MKICRVFAAFVILLTASQMFAGTEISNETAAVFNPPRFEVAVESGYLFGVINPPQDYEIGALFLTGRVRWGVLDTDSWLRGYNQFYVSAIAEPIFRGIENHYFGLNFGGRYNFVQPGWRLNPYISGGLGLGWIDSHPNIPGAQGQDFLPTEQSLETGRRNPLPASLQWRADRSEPEFESPWSTSWSRLLLLSWRKSPVFRQLIAQRSLRHELSRGKCPGHQTQFI